MLQAGMNVGGAGIRVAEWIVMNSYGQQQTSQRNQGHTLPGKPKTKTVFCCILVARRAERLEA